MKGAIRVGLDAHMVGGRETGNETYVLGLVQGMREIAARVELIVYHAGGFRDQLPPGFKLEKLLTGSPLTRLTVDLPMHSWRDHLEVLHTSYVVPLWAACASVVTVHDISFEAHPEWFSPRDLRVLSTLVPWSVRRAERVITVSQVCRQEIVERYRVPEDKVVCIHNAAGPAAQKIGADEAREELQRLGIDISRPVILGVGNLQPRKNLVRLIQAFGQLVSEGIDAELVLAGPEHYRAHLVRDAAAGLSERIHLTGYLSHRQLAACYAAARVFVFPSMYEGFGLPALEAMAHGTPVVCSNGGALPEVCGEAVLYVDPYDADSIAAAIRRVLTEPALGPRLSAAGLARERQFSWVRTAEETLTVYGQAMRQRGLRNTVD